MDKQEYIEQQAREMAVRFELTMRPHVKQKLLRAAKKSGVSLAAFMRASALSAANRVLGDDDG